MGWDHSRRGGGSSAGRAIAWRRGKNGNARFHGGDDEKGGGVSPSSLDCSLRSHVCENLSERPSGGTARFYRAGLLRERASSPAPRALARAPISKDCGGILGIVPIALFLCFPPDWTAWNGFFFGFAAMGLVSPYPDLYNVFQVLRQTPRRCQIQFWGDDTYYFMGESL